jgi:hypothetical protein
MADQAQRKPRLLLDKPVLWASLIVVWLAPLIGWLLLELGRGRAPEWVLAPIRYMLFFEALGETGSEARTISEIVNQALGLVEIYVESFIFTHALFLVYDIVRTSRLGCSVVRTTVALADWAVERIDGLSRPRR